MILNKPEWETWKEILKELSSYGWYLMGDFTVNKLDEVSALLDKGNIKALDLLMIQVVEDNLNKITKAILHKHPDRKPPLEQAFLAHKSELYYLSIPVFFAQIDGLCGEGTGEKFFLNRKLDNNEYVPKVRDWAL